MKTDNGTDEQGKATSDNPLTAEEAPAGAEADKRTLANAVAEILANPHTPEELREQVSAFLREFRPYVGHLLENDPENVRKYFADALGGGER
jgi:cytochrome P450